MNRWADVGALERDRIVGELRDAAAGLERELVRAGELRLDVQGMARQAAAYRAAAALLAGS
jgi:hypothetical protein